MPVITIKQDFDRDELPRIHLQQVYDDGTKEKMDWQIEELEAELARKSWTGRGEIRSLPDGHGKGKWDRRAKHWE
jgi:hypothetical protein